MAHAAELGETSVVLRYDGLDGLLRQSAISFSQPPDKLTAECAEFLVAVTKRSSKVLYIEIGPEVAEMPDRSGKPLYKFVGDDLTSQRRMAVIYLLMPELFGASKEADAKTLANQAQSAAASACESWHTPPWVIEGGTSRPGLRSKKPTGFRLNPSLATGITGQSSGRTTWCAPNVYQTTTSVSTMGRLACV